jgi:hypothetical protein
LELGQLDHGGMPEAATQTQPQGWTQTETKLIAETMLGRGVSRIGAIQYLRRHRRIGETSLRVVSTGVFSGDTPYGPLEIDAHFSAGQPLTPNTSQGKAGTETVEVWQTTVVIRRKRESTAQRRYRPCEMCGRKFLAKRANNTTCSARCRSRSYRRDRKRSNVTDFCTAPL